MGTLWGQATEIEDLGVVAEQCPFCEQTTPCLVRAARPGWQILFLRLSADTQDTSGLCTSCRSSFPCELWRYPELVPAAQAESLSSEDLLARTNPGLAERLQLREQVSVLGGDDRFAAAYD